MSPTLIIVIALGSITFFGFLAAVIGFLGAVVNEDNLTDRLQTYTIAQEIEISGKDNRRRIVRRQDLGDEHRQRLRRRKQPLPMRRQAPFNLLEQHLTGQKIERAQTITSRPLAANQMASATPRQCSIQHEIGPWSRVDGFAIGNPSLYRSLPLYSITCALCK